MAHWVGDLLFAALAVPAYLGGPWVVGLCALAVAASLILSLTMVGEGWLLVDRLAMLGLAVSVLVALVPPPIGKMAKDIAFIFLAALCVRRFGLPAFRIWRMKHEA